MTENNNKWTTNGRSGGAPTPASNGESGILRKTTNYTVQDNFDDLLVFGYSCKVFRDDHKALFIDQGKHLIPWMGDNSLKIDRYDARGALHDLTQYEPPQGGYKNRLEYLTPAEQRAEQLCEEERYFSLYSNEVEEELYQEESAKRGINNYGQVSFSYDNVETTVENENDGDDAEDSEPYVPPMNFELPSDIDLPETMKEHAIIEKTAKFISSQGPQMEILLKAKQANNSQFDFLNQNGKLYRYYRHILMAIKNNRYPLDPYPRAIDESNDENGGQNASGTRTDNYLQNASGAYLTPKIIVPAIKYKPSADCAYTQLISKITGAPIPLNVHIEEKMAEEIVTITPTQLTALTDFGYYQQDNSLQTTNLQLGGVEVKKISTGLVGLAQNYNSGSDSDNEDDDNEGVEYKEIEYNGVMPPDYLQHIIDRTAIYVAKNGRNFEDILKTKDDPRFLFLNDDHEFNPYYTFKVRHSINPYEINVIQKTSKASTNNSKKVDPIDDGKPKIIAPVSFSIKAKDEPAVPLKPVLPQEPSSDEEELSNGSEPVKINDEIVKNDSSKDITPPPPSITTTEFAFDSHKLNIDQRLREPTPPPPPPVATVDYITALEIVDEQKEAKRSEDKLKDRLASAAREKLGLISKEKQLQLERKKKAMAFLHQIKGSGSSDNSSSYVKNGTSTCKNESGSEDGDESIHSIPSNSPPSERVSNIEMSVDIVDADAHDDEDSDVDDTDDVIVIKDRKSRSRSSRSKSAPSRHKRKKSKHSHHSKKKSKRKTRSRSRSKSHSSRYRSRSRSPEKKYRKHSHKSSSHHSRY